MYKVDLQIKNQRYFAYFPVVASYHICFAFYQIKKHYNVIANYYYVLYSGHNTVYNAVTVVKYHASTRCYKKVIYHFMAWF